MRTALITWLLAAGLVACSGDDGGDGGTDAGPQQDPGIHELYLNDQLLGVTEVTFIKGRCLGRLNIDAQTSAAQDAALLMATSVAEAIPLDGSAPADDGALVELVPQPPLSGALADWSEDSTDQINGPWLVSTSAFDWINGSGPPFEDNGFEAVAGERYDHGAEGWNLNLELINMGSTQGAVAAFRAASWDSGQQQ